MSICGSYVQTIVLRHDAGMFTVKGINRLKILQDAIDRNLHPGQAAEMLGITPRHCRRLLKRYRQLGPLGMNNHSRGRVGNHLLPTSLIDQALCIIREHYRDPQIEDSEHSRRAIGKYIEVWHYPDGHKELRLNGVLLPYSTFDRLSEVDPVAIVDNKRLGHVLGVARQAQRKLDNNRSLK